MNNFKDLANKNDTQKIYFYLSLPSFLIALTLILTILLIFEFLPKKLPLFYSLPWGESQLVSHQQFYIIPASILLIAFINLLILLKLNSSFEFFKKILVFSTIITTIILTITFLKIVLIFI